MPHLARDGPGAGRPSRPHSTSTSPRNSARPSCACASAGAASPAARAAEAAAASSRPGRASTPAGSTARVYASPEPDDERPCHRAHGAAGRPSTAACCAPPASPHRSSSERVGAHPRARVEREPDEQLGGLSRGHRDQRAVPADLDRAEHGHSQHTLPERTAPHPLPSARRQRVVSAAGHGASCARPDPTRPHDPPSSTGSSAATPTPPTEVLAAGAPRPASVLLVAAALLAADPELLAARRPARRHGPGPAAGRPRRCPPARRRRPARRTRAGPPRRAPRQPAARPGSPAARHP